MLFVLLSAEMSLTNSENLEQSLGPFCLPPLFKLVNIVKQLYAAADLRRQHFKMHFFGCALRVKKKTESF